MSDQRFFIDHGVIHDRSTGRHVRAGRPEDCGNEDGIEECCALLNSLDAGAADAADANRYHQRLGAKWMCEAIVREINGAFSQNRHARAFAEHIARKWEVVSYWRPGAAPEAAEPDAKCVTTGDGGCEGSDCMHDPLRPRS